MDIKTRITPAADNPAGNQQNGGGLYGRSADRPEIKRTYIQGMKPRSDANEDSRQASPDTRALNICLQDRPVAGMLFSVSRDNMGEIFPVYVGRNTIGSEAECDVYLTEETVSANHAVLLVRMLPDSNGGRTMSMSITDYDSEFGTALNDRPVGYDRETLYGGEILKFGNAYEFVFIPLDADKFGLSQMPGFMAIPRKNVRENMQMAGFYAPASEEEIYPSVVGIEDERTFYGRTYAKKEDHSSKKTL